ncbi:3-oxoacyl-ACP synthase [Sedimentibacter saalensis]|uniref:3-oxoacyl-[acyl-carrier-protein] synthase-3 n=1 Tax=Sedimentibacter saalensis TaxID=130788 RepID=A0A562J4M7_9FIRM|nr:3-oxoacyl-ACP synthase [Sedimentibacter saalensis]TWH78131.1 3-oxoacyl-[acyl-carrier-protein] synthase-3 [Sedimentibacter saalensis]
MDIVGIKNIGIYVPPKIKDSAKIAELSGIPEDVIREKFGIVHVHEASQDETVSFMGIEAAKRAIEGFDPKKLDLVVYCGSEYKDYYLFNCAAKIQHEIGAVNANAFEIHSLCSAGVYSLKILKSIMLCDDSINHVLLVSSSKETQIINYKNHNSRFMFNFGDGAAAVLLEKGLDKNVILETHMISDGQFAEDVAVFGVGCRNFKANADIKCSDKFLNVPDIQSMKKRLDPITLDNFNNVIAKSIKKSGYTDKDIGFVAPIFMKRSILEKILEKYNLTEDNSFVLEEYGHCQSADAFISLTEGEKKGRLKKGKIAVLLGAGTGYTWAATAVRWG